MFIYEWLQAIQTREHFVNDRDSLRDIRRENIEPQVLFSVYMDNI